MIPTLKLGSWESPRIEILPQDINSITAFLVDQFSPLDQNDQNHLWHFLQIDAISLDDESESFFLKLEDICRRIVAGELAQYNVTRIRMSEFADYLKGAAKDGVVTPEVKAAAQRFLDFLADHPDYWPLQEHASKAV